MNDTPEGSAQEPAEPKSSWLSKARSKPTSFNKLSPKMALTSLALVLSLLAYVGLFDFLINLSPVPGLETAAEEYFERTRERAAYTYVSARLLNATISTLQSVHLSAGIIGADPLQFLDPIDDLVEKFSTIMLISLASVLTQELLLKIGSLVALSSILPVAFLVLAAKPWLPAGADRRCLGIFYGIVVVTVVAKLFSPVTGAVGSYVSEEFLIDDYDEAVADLTRVQTELQAESAELPSSEEINSTLSERSKRDVPVESETVTEVPSIQQNTAEEPSLQTSDVQIPEGGSVDEITSETESGGFIGTLQGMMDDTKAATKGLMNSAISGTEKLIDNPVDVTKQFASDAASATVDAAVATKDLAVDTASATADVAVATKDLTVEAVGVTVEAAADAFSATGSFVDKSFDAVSNLLPSFVFPDVQSIKESLGNIADSILVLIKIFVFEVLLLPLLSGYLLYRVVRSVFQVGGVHEVHLSSPQATTLAVNEG